MAESKRRKIEPRFLSQLNKEEKKIISSKIAKNCSNLARELNFDEPEIENIDYICYGKDLREYCMAIITEWEEKEGAQASKERMIQALTNIQRQDIVDQLCDKKDRPKLSKQNDYDFKRNNLIGCNHISGFIFVFIISIIIYFFVSPVYQEQELLHKQKEIQSKLESAQLEVYKGIEMEIAPWMTDTYLPLQELYVELQMFSADKFGNEDNGVLIHIDEIFNLAEGNTQPRRILVEGDAGFGKTTLLNKLVDDWTKKKNYIYHRYRNVFLFYLRDCNDDQSFEDFIRMECKSLGVDKEEGLKCVKTFEKETLFLLDGYDELSDNSKSKFENILLREKFKHATIIVTSRRGEFQTQNKKKIGPGLSDKHRSRNDHIYIWDKRILISGISEENRKTFLEKYLQIKNVNQSFHFSQHFQIADKDLFRCPLFLILLATVKDEENVQLIDTQTDFYKFLLNVVTRRSLVRIHELDESENVELFDSNHENYHEECAKQMDLFGSLAIQHLIKDKLTFTQEEIEECCGKDANFTKLGFINRRMTYKKWNRKNYFEPFHKSFLEFFAAFSLYRLAMKSEKSNHEEFKKKISDLVLGNIIPDGTSLIYPFLAGLLNTESSVLFDALSPWGSLMNIFDYSFIKLLIETKKPETLISSLVPFIPPILLIHRYIYNDEYYSTTFEVFFHKFFFLFLSYFKFHTVSLLYPFPFQIRTKNCDLELFDSNDNRSSILETRDDLPVVECENLLYTFHWGKTYIWEKVIKIFLQTKFKTLAITLNYCIDLIILLHKELIDGCLKDFDIDQLTIKDEIDFINSPEIYFCLFDLVQNKRIKNIKFRGYFTETPVIKNKTFDFLDWECFNEISIEYEENLEYEEYEENLEYEEYEENLKNKENLENEKCEKNARAVIPFSLLCQSFKKWKTITFGNLFDYSLTNSNVSCSVEEIIFGPCLDKESCEFVLKHCTGFTTLECNVQLLNTCFSTNQFSTLQDLRVNFFSYQNFDWTKLLFVLPRLRSLSIQAYEDQHSDFANSLTSFVYQSELEILKLDGTTKNLLLILQNVYIGIEKQEMNTTEILSIDSEMGINQNNCSSNLKSLEIHLILFNDQESTQAMEIIFLCKQFLKKYFVKEISLILKGFNEKIDFIYSNLFLSISEGFLLSRDKLNNILQLDEEILIISLDPKLN